MPTMAKEYPAMPTRQRRACRPACKRWRKLLCLAAFGVLLTWLAGAEAAETAPGADAADVWRAWEMNREYAAGIHRYDFDPGHSVIGWHVDERWYLGRLRGEHGGFGFTRRGEHTDIRISNRGVRISLRF